MQTVRNLIRHISSALGFITLSVSIGFLIAMLVLVLVQVFARYGLNNAPAWTEEAARYCMIWCGLFGGIAAFSVDLDPCVITVSSQSSRTRQRLKHWTTFICIGLFLGPLGWLSFGFVSRASLRTSEALNWNLGIVAVILPIYCALILAQSLLKALAFELSATTPAPGRGQTLPPPGG